MPFPVSRNVVRKRGDTKAHAITVRDGDDVGVDITGATFRLVVDPSSAPPDNTNNLFDIVGTITDAPAGKVRFPFSAPQADQTPQIYFYEIEMTEPNGEISTLMFGQWEYRQDIAK